MKSYLKGGLSGIGIHPVAVHMVYHCFTSCCRRANVPIIGIGGVSNHDEALELILAGAACVGIGTAMFRDPTVFEKVAEGLRERVIEKGVESVVTLVGRAAIAKGLSFNEIATFLNISETEAKSLCGRALLPGSPSNGEWLTTKDEVRNWYLNLTGSQWANLISDGNIDPISVEVYLDPGVIHNQGEKLTSVVQQWQETGVAEVLEQWFESDGTKAIKMRLIEDNDRTRQELEGIRKRQAKVGATTETNQILKSVFDELSVTYEDKLTLAGQPVVLTSSPDGMVRLTAEEDLEYLLQRDREIIRVFLASYVERLSSKLQRD